MSSPWPDSPSPPRPKKAIKLNFRYFWPGFNYQEQFGFLDDLYDIELSDQPDVLIYSCFAPGQPLTMPHIPDNVLKIFYTAENIRPDMSRCDYALSFCHPHEIDHPRHFRVPNYVLRLKLFGYDPQVLIKTPQSWNATAILKAKSKFCNFIYSNDRCEARNHFFHLLSDYKPVDSAGRLFNTVGNPISRQLPAGHFEKIAFMRPYKFSIAFENASAPGYTTEKIVEAILAQTVPIYWGDPQVSHDFNPKSFISFYEDCHGSLDALKKKVIEVDQDDALYMAYLNEPFLHGNVLPPHLEEPYLVNIFSQILG